MKRLNYKTRGQSSPTGKSKVYFSCHPADFELYFDLISEEILQSQNCAIWYDTMPEEEGDEEFYEDLKGMNLFVIPITTRFLSEENKAKDKEFRFAIEQHIPLLPIMQESGIEDAFNFVCGNYQFLIKDNNDRTAIPYEEKLNLFLRTVLVGDEMSEKIRKAFDAYIFLSYRKIDRKHAQELMKLIHEMPEYRDIAMWYDEYLVPGENFDDSIMDALIKSDFFVMVVTPNLLSKGNYIMNKEYPAAVKEHKLIVPVEMVDTDKNNLREYFPGVSRITNPCAGEEFQRFMMETVQNLSLNKNNSSPEHLFFIGLAYIGGIDMEVNVEKGRKLLQESADAGFIPAYSKLVSMYLNGDGVERDEDQATQYQEKLVERAGVLFQNEKSREKYQTYFQGYMDLGEMLLNQRKLDRAKEKYKEALIIAAGDEEGISRIYNAIGDISFINGELSEAEEYFGKCIEIREKLNRELQTDQSRRNLAVGYQKLGKVLFKDRHMTRALDITEKCAQMTEEIMEKDKNINNRLFYAQACDDMCEILRQQGEFEKAFEWVYKGLRIKEDVQKEEDSQKVLDALSDSYWSISYIYFGMLNEKKSNENRTKCIELRKKCLDFRKEAYAKQPTLYAKHKLAQGYRHYASEIWKVGEVDQAQEEFEKAIRMQKELCSVANTVEYRRELTFSYNNLSVMYRKKERYLEAKELREKILDIRLGMVKDVQSFIVYRDLAIAHNNLATILRDLKDFEGAELHFLEGLKIRQEHTTREDSVRSQMGIATNYAELGLTRKLMGDFQKAKEYLEMSIKIREDILSATELPKVRDEMEKSKSYYQEVMEALKNNG